MEKSLEELTVDFAKTYVTAYMASRETEAVPFTIEQIPKLLETIHGSLSKLRSNP